MPDSPTADPVAHLSIRRDHGQAAVSLVGAVVTLLVVMLVALVGVGETSLDRTRAQSAADAAALASLHGGRAAAERFASAHGGELVEWVEGPGPDEVTVTVRIGRTSATARASDSVRVGGGAARDGAAQGRRGAARRGAGRRGVVGRPRDEVVTAPTSVRSVHSAW